MATQGHYLVTRSTEDASALLVELERTRTIARRITERMEAIGSQALAGYEWPEGYTGSDFLELYQALNTLPGSVVDDDTRDALFKLVSFIQ